MTEERLPGGELTKSKKIHVYRNGDQFNSGKDLVINPRNIRTYDTLLEQVTVKLAPKFGAVRCLRTPDTGNIVRDMGELEHGKSYVACAKGFSKIGYQDIRDPPVKHPPPMDLTSPRERKRFAISGRIKKTRRNPITLNVYTNGEPLLAARRVLIQPWIHKTWEAILELISSKISLRSGALRQLLRLADKNYVHSGSDLISEEFYVAIGSERFKDFEYGLNPTVIFSPQQQQARRYPSLAPLKGRSSNTMSGMSGSTVASTTTNKSEQSSSKALRKAQPKPPKEEEGIPVKPLKHKRSPAEERQKPKEKTPEPPAKKNPPTKNKKDKIQKEVKEVDLDKDESGIYRSKNEKEKADAVEEDTETKNEVPIDDREAEEVVDEDATPRTNSVNSIQAHSARSNKTVSSTKEPVKEKKSVSTEKNSAEDRAPSTNQLTEDEAATKIQAQFRGYTTRKELAGKEEVEVAEETAPKLEVTAEPTKEEEEAGEEDETAREAAAIKIQAGYRGYQVRRDMTHRKAEANEAGKEGDSAETNPEQSTDKEEREKAAIKIQANYRGYATRKQLKAGEADQRAVPDKESPDGSKSGQAEDANSKAGEPERAQPPPVESQG